MSDGFKLFTGQEDKIYIYDYPFTYLKKVKPNEVRTNVYHSLRYLPDFHVIL